jgi:hypothetical protein
MAALQLLGQRSAGGAPRPAPFSNLAIALPSLHLIRVKGVGVPRIVWFQVFLVIPGGGLHAALCKPSTWATSTSTRSTCGQAMHSAVAQTLPVHRLAALDALRGEEAQRAHG